MRIVRIVFAVFLGVFILPLSSYAQEVKSVSFATVDYKPAGEAGERFSKGYGQCVDFVKQSRPDLMDIGKVGTAANMPNVAKEKGFEVNALPRVGSALVMPDVKIVKTGEVTGHVAIVTKIEEVKNGMLTLTIRDANAKNDVKYDQNGKILQGSSVIERTITYDMKEKKVTDGILKEQSNVVFIHERKEVYNNKQIEAISQVTQIFKNVLGREPNDAEKNGYTQKLMSGVISSQQLQANIKKLPEYDQRITELRKEIKKSQEEAKKPMVKRIVDEGIGNAKEQVKSFLNKYIGVKEVKAASPKLPSDASKLSQYTAQQQLTPTKVEFTQTFDGLFTQSADFVGSRYGNHSGSLTDGTRVNSIGDSRAGDFTGSFSGRTVAEPGYTPATHNNSAFSGSSVGKISAIGFKEGDLKGNMTVTVPAGTQTIQVTGDIKIKTDGSLSMPSYTGPVTDNATGNKVGTMSGSWSQSKTR